ncbi:MAG: RNA methyltransferase substrate-binding domain-containing protein, partial [Nostocoides sp.]
MLANPRADRVRTVRALARRQAREKYGQFLAEGPQSVREAIRHAPSALLDVYATAEAGQRYAVELAEAVDHRIHVHTVTDEVLAAMVGTDAPQGLLAVCRVPVPGPDPLGDVLAGEPRLLVLLTNVRDPGNAGTVIRAADAFGADAVLVSEGSVDVHSPKVVRSSA